MTERLDVLLPTCDRPAALAVTLTALLAQDLPLRVVVADQGAGADDPLLLGVRRVLVHLGHLVEWHVRPERLGIAEQREFLLAQAVAQRCVLLDDDVLLAPGSLHRLSDALDQVGGGFVGMTLTGLSYLDDERPHEQVSYEPWSGPVQPERVRKDGPAWERWRLHNAANPVHLARRHVPAGQPWVAYKVAWVAGCVLFHTEALREIGGFGFWPQLGPTGAGEDVAVQLAVMERRGGSGLLPSGAFHLEVATTLPDRTADGYDLLVAGPEQGSQP